MKNIRDLEIMKETTCKPFGTEYEYLMSRLENNYIAKTDGVNRIRAELSDWDVESKKLILEELAERIIESRLLDFDRHEILQIADEF